MMAPFRMVLGYESWPRSNRACQIDSCILDGGLSVTNARHRMATLILPTAIYLNKALAIYSTEASGENNICSFSLVVAIKFIRAL